MAITKRQAAELAKQTFEYVPAPEAIDHVRIQPRYGLFIGGKMVEPHSKKRFQTINPATENKLSEVAEADAVDVGKAVTAASTAFKLPRNNESARSSLPLICFPPLDPDPKDYAQTPRHN